MNSDPGGFSNIPPEHDARVVGDLPVVVIDVIGMKKYAKEISLSLRRAVAQEIFPLLAACSPLPASIIALFFGCALEDFFARFFVKLVFSDFAVHELLPCRKILEKA